MISGIRSFANRFKRRFTKASPVFVDAQIEDYLCWLNSVFFHTKEEQRKFSNALGMPFAGTIPSIRCRKNSFLLPTKERRFIFSDQMIVCSVVGHLGNALLFSRSGVYVLNEKDGSVKETISGPCVVGDNEDGVLVNKGIIPYGQMLNPLMKKKELGRSLLKIIDGKKFGEKPKPCFQGSVSKTISFPPPLGVSKPSPPLIKEKKEIDPCVGCMVDKKMCPMCECYKGKNKKVVFGECFRVLDI